jgi:protein-S-isoprenylcysteine O-methyltransferase Ste14
MHNNKLKDGSVIIQLSLIMLMIFFSVYESGSVPARKYSADWGLAIMIVGFLLIVSAIISFNQVMTPSPVPQENYVLKTTGFINI